MIKTAAEQILERDVAAAAKWLAMTQEHEGKTDMTANLSRINRLRAAADAIDNAIRAAVKVARSTGDDPASWSEIGTELRMTKQGAQQRYGS